LQNIGYESFVDSAGNFQYSDSPAVIAGHPLRRHSYVGLMKLLLIKIIENFQKMHNKRWNETRENTVVTIPLSLHWVYRSPLI